MKCAICGKECVTSFLYLGGFCGEEHRQEILQRHQQLLDELRREDINRMPDSLSQDDFERFTLKLAIRLVDGLSPAMRQFAQQWLPLMLDPLQMALEIKEHLLLQLPADHVTLEPVMGLAAVFFSGRYSFLQPVPAVLIRQAVENAGLMCLLEG